MADISITESAGKKYVIHQETSIQVSLSGFSFLVKNNQMQPVIFRHYKITGSMLEDEVIRKTAYWIENDELIKKECPIARFIYLSQKSILVPEEFFDVNQLKKMYEFNLTLGEFEELHPNYIPELKLYNVFAVPSYLASVVSQKFKEVEYIHQATLLIKKALKLAQKGNENLALLNINYNFFDLVILQDQKLLLYNSYQYVNQTDFVYFLLYAFKQLDIEIDSTKLIISGEQFDNPAILNELKKYTEKISFIEKEPFNGRSAFKKLDTRKYHLLFY